jgi:D-alanine-D-alanine ligase-like ATP-grasp enzyme
MAPSLVAASPSGRRVHITPAPPHVVPPAAAAALREHAAELGEHLGLRGLAQLDGFVNAETGDIIVLDARAFPKLADGHPLLQQVREGGCQLVWWRGLGGGRVGPSG